MNELQNTPHSEIQSSVFKDETILYLLDLSGSMGNNFSQTKTKAQVQKDAFVKFVEQRKKSGSKSKFGAIGFGVLDNPGIAVISLPGASESDLKTGIDRYLGFGIGNTPLAEAIDKSKEILDDMECLSPHLIIFCDGSPSSPSVCLEKAKILHNMEGFIIDAVYIKDFGENEYCESFMNELAKNGGGRFYKVNDSDEFVNLMLEFEEQKELLLTNGVLLLGE